MSQLYTEQTERILQDFLDALEKEAAVDRAFLADIKRMARDGALSHRSRVQTAMANMEKRLGDQARRPGR